MTDRIFESFTKMLEELKIVIKRKVKRETPLWHALMFIKQLPFRYNPLLILRRKNLIPWVPNKRSIEIEITTRCSLACFNCDRSIRQAPSDDCMSLEQIEKFVDESIKLNWGWKHIRLTGGEPTLHPQFFEILKIVKRYKEINFYCNVEISTNGYGSQVNEVLSKLPQWICVINSRKKSNINNFCSYNIAPIDLKEYENSDFTKGCWITGICGLGLTKYGYYPCGAGASVDRVFGFDIGQRSLSCVNNLTLREQLRVLCRYCGHYKENYADEKITLEKMSISWQKAYEIYKRKRPQLSVY